MCVAGTQIGSCMNDLKRRTRGNGGLVAICIAVSGLIAGLKRIPLTNRIGDDGNAFWGIAYDTYLLFFLICGYSMQTVAASMISSRRARGQYRNARRVWLILLILAAGGGLIAGLLMFFLSGWISGGLFKTLPAQTAIQFMAPGLLFSSLLGLYRGYFQGMGSDVPTALSRFVEELAGLFFMLHMASRLGDYGKQVGALLRDPGYEQAFGAAGGLLGGVIGEAIAVVFLFILFVMFQVSFRRKEKRDAGKGTESYGRITRIAVNASFPVMLTGLTVHGCFILDQILYLVLMPKAAGNVTNWGIYTGKYRILSSLPVALVTAVCSALVPSLSAAHAARNMGRTRERAYLLIRTSLILSLPLAIYFATMADALLPALFSVGDMKVAASLLRRGSIAIVLQCAAVALSCILQAMDKKRNLLFNAVGALILHAVLLYFLLSVGGQGILGVVNGVIVLYAACLIFHLLSLRRLISLRAGWGRMLGIPAICAGVSGLVLFFMAMLLKGKIADNILSVLGFVVGGGLYFVLILALHGITERDLKAVPGGGVILSAARLLRLM